MTEITQEAAQALLEALKECQIFVEMASTAVFREEGINETLKSSWAAIALATPGSP